MTIRYFVTLFGDENDVIYLLSVKAPGVCEYGNNNVPMFFVVREKNIANLLHIILN